MRVCPDFKTRRVGFTLVEAMMALTIVSLSCSAMLLSVEQAMQVSKVGIDTTRASSLAHELLTEISAARWADADQPTHWGPEDGEANTPTRAKFDDLDDYAGWYGVAQTRTGQTYDTVQKKFFANVPSHSYAKYYCSVLVEYVSQMGEPMPAGQISPYRRVTIAVSHYEQPNYQLSQVFQDHAPLMGRNHWFDPNTQEAANPPTIVP